MRKILFFKRLKENVRASSVNLACVFMIALLTGACASEYKKQTSSYANETGQVSAKGESENGETNDDQEIECRWKVFTGSLLKRKVCLTKAEWAELDKKNRRKVDDFFDEVSDHSDVDTGSSADAMGGQSSGMPR